MKRIQVAFFLYMLALPLFSQNQVGEFLRAGKEDAAKLSKAYLEPYGEMLGVNLNAGWYNSASVHKLGGFDITILGTYSKVPSSGKTYDIDQLGLSAFKVAEGSSSIAPTISGKMSDAELPRLTPQGATSELVSFKVPNGEELDFMVLPMVQAAVGLPFKSEIVVRFMPELEYGDLGKIGLWGVGLKHNVDHYIPGLKSLPFLNITVMGAYSKLSGEVTLPDNAYITNGILTLDAGAFTSRVLVGASLPVVAFYTGVGYGSANTDFDINGTYAGETGNVIALSYKNNGVNFNAGMRIRLGILALHGDYTVGEYSMFTAGVGFSFR